MAAQRLAMPRSSMHTQTFDAYSFAEADNPPKGARLTSVRPLEQKLQTAVLDCASSYRQTDEETDDGELPKSDCDLRLVANDDKRHSPRARIAVEGD